MRFTAEPSFRYNLVLAMLVTSGAKEEYVEWNREFYRASRKSVGGLARDLRSVFKVWSESMLMRVFSGCEDSVESMLGWLDDLLSRPAVECVRVALGHAPLSDEEFLRGAAEEVGGLQRAVELVEAMHRALSVLRRAIPEYYGRFFEGAWRAEILPRLEEECGYVGSELQMPGVHLEAVGHIEELTGRRVPLSEVALCPSPFPPRYRGYGVRRDRSLDIVYRMPMGRGRAAEGAARMVAHEVTHCALSTPPIWDSPELSRAFSEWLARSPEFARAAEEFSASYATPQAFFEENLVLAMSYVVLERLGLMSEEESREAAARAASKGFVAVPQLYEAIKALRPRERRGRIEELLARALEGLT